MKTPSLSLGWCVGVLGILACFFTVSVYGQSQSEAELYNRGLAKYAKGDIDGAIADFTKAIALMPGDGKAYSNRGIAKSDKGDFIGAIADYTKAIVLMPNSAIPYNNRGDAKSAAGDIDGAIADFTKAIALKPDYDVAYFNRGNEKKAKGDINGAMADYTKAIALRPNYAGAYDNRYAFQRNPQRRAVAQTPVTQRGRRLRRFHRGSPFLPAAPDTPPWSGWIRETAGGFHRVGPVPRPAAIPIRIGDHRLLAEPC